MCCNLFKIDVQWPQDVSTSPWLPQWIYVLLVGLVTTLFLAFQIVHLMDFFPKFGWFYFVFLTNWALVLESLTLLLLWVSTIWAYGSAPGEGQKAPLFVRYALSLWYIIQPMSLVVVILYWTVVNQFWDPYAIEFSSLSAHLLNWMVLIVHLFVSNLPWSFKNGIWAFMFSVVFVIWTIIHYFLEIGKGIPCDDYEIEKCPIYNTFDWNKPGQTIGICVGASVALLVVLGLYTGLFRCRDACSGRGRTSTGEKDVEAAAAS